jgi:hypothetical protein
MAVLSESSSQESKLCCTGKRGMTRECFEKGGIRQGRDSRREGFDNSIAGKTVQVVNP